MTDGQLSAYKHKWDPSLYLPNCKIPTLFYIGTNDPAFPLDIWQKSALLVKEKMLSIPISTEHGHIWNQKEIFAFADAVAGDDNHLLQIGNTKIADDIASAEISNCSDTLNCFISSVQLVYTKDTGSWQFRKWQSLPAALKRNIAICELPPLTKACYFNITDNHGLTFSSAYKEIQ